MFKFLISKGIGVLGLGKVKLILAGIVVAVAVGFWMHYQGLRAERDQLMLVAQQAVDAHAVTKASFDTYRHRAEESMLTLRKNLAKLSRQYRESEVQRNELKELLSRIDLKAQMVNDPAGTESAINARLCGLWRGLSEVSGAGSSGGARCESDVPPPASDGP